jgi:hypothetical protein
MQTPLRACAWLTRPAMTPCAVDVPVFAITIRTPASLLGLTTCRDHLGAVVTAAFATGGVPVASVLVERHAPA